MTGGEFIAGLGLLYMLFNRRAITGKDIILKAKYLSHYARLSGSQTLAGVTNVVGNSRCPSSSSSSSDNIMFPDRFNFGLFKVKVNRHYISACL